MTDIKQFMGRIQSATPQHFDIFGKGLPGVSGRSVVVAGAANAAADVTMQLQRETIKLAQLFRNPAGDYAALETQSKKVEGLIMAEQTLGTFSGEEADQLINELYDLVEQKR